MQTEAMLITEMAKKAEEIIKLNKRMNEIFRNNEEAHLRLCIMAGLCDAYKLGKKERK